MPAGSTYSTIATTTLGSAASTYTFTSIPSTYTDLVLVVNLIANTAGLNAAMRFNSDSGNNYSYTSLMGNGSTASSTRSAEDFARLDYFGAVATTSGQISISNIMSYSNTNRFKTSLTRNNQTVGSFTGVEAFVNLWRSTSAITSITVFARNDSFAAGSTLTLYGITAA